MIKLITSDTKGDIVALLENLDRSFYLISPFIGINTAVMLAKVLVKKHLKVVVITRFSSRDFQCGVSSLEGLKILLNAGCELKAVKQLHTKLYVFDEKAFILGSSNFTDGGLISNIELNILVKDDEDIVTQGIAYFNEINGLIESEYFIDEKMILDEINFQNTIKGKQDFPAVDDFGAELRPKKPFSNIEKIFYQAPVPQVSLTGTIWIKFEGYSDNRRTANDLPLDINLTQAGAYRTRFPSKPTGFRDGDLVFLARSSWDNNGEKTPVIYGYGIAQKFNVLNVIPEKEQQQDKNLKRWNYFIYVDDFKSVVSLKDGISLLDVLREVGYNTYPKASERKDSYKKLKQIHMRKDKLQMTRAAADYLVANLKLINQ